jgi:hypothetical protein
MEWLMIIAFIVVSIMDSKKKSEQAKQQREQRQKMQGQQVYRSESQPKAAVKPESAKPAEKRQTVKTPENQMYGPLGEFLEELENWASAIDSTEHPAKPSGSPVKKPASAKNVSVKPKTQKQSMQTAKKEPAALPTKTLMEMRPDREKREEHTKVTANVKPLKSAYENDEKCEHRIELNPNIQYSKQQQKETAQAAAIVKTDKDSLVQGIIWSEILGKPKAYQPNQPVFRTGRNR